VAQGFLALIPGDHRLYGKVVAQERGSCEVEYFLSVAHREVKRHPRNAVTHARLQKQTRVFLQDSTGNWRVGRVREALREDDGSFVYEVRFPNGHDANVSERDLYVRCLDEFADPAEILAAGCAETQYFADRRRRALRRMSDLRGASQGLTGLLSSAVELVPHQVAAVRRVLSDPLQRYLLADEVGLGKTIEAGAIIRQLLIDRTVEKIGVLAPDNLVHQWKTELKTRFFVDDFEEADVDVYSHEEAPLVARDGPPDLLVIDEAHKVVAIDSTLTQSVRQLARQCPRLLLLSATPALADETRFLAVLNLLDPAAFPTDQPDSFHRKMVKRQEIGRFLLAFRPGVHAFVLKQQARMALDLFPGDPEITRLATKIASSEQAGPLDAEVNDLRDHVARTYRIHHRVIRARRSDIEGWAMWPRGPRVETSEGYVPTLRHVRLEFDSDQRNTQVWNALEAWRDSATRALDAKPTIRSALTQRCVELHSVATAGADALGAYSGTLKPLFEEEVSLLQEFCRLGVAEGINSQRHVAIGKALRDWKLQQPPPAPGRPPAKICCFCTSVDDATKLLTYLQATIGAGYVASAVASDSSAQVVSEFELHRTRWVLICDSRSEEGLNLQFAHTIFHADLPFAPARLEQRIGRLDRFGRRINGVSHRVFLPTADEDAPWRAWFDLLANAFFIFNQSVSDVQFLLDRLQVDVANALLANGASGLTALSMRIREQISEERQRLDEQHALDALSLMQESGVELTRAIEASEDDEDQIAADIAPWIVNVLGVKQYFPRENREVLRFFWDDDTLLSSIPWKQLLNPGLERPSTWKRHCALREGAVLIRPGCALVEALERIARWDDRGVGYSTWRREPGWKGVWRGFRLIWHVEPNCHDAAAVYSYEDDPELRRHAERFLKPQRYEQVFDESIALVTEGPLLDLLARPYSSKADASGRQDFNLGSRFSDLQQEIDATLLARLIDSVRNVGREALVKSAPYQTALLSARERCDIEARRSRTSIAQRAALHRAEHGLEPPWRAKELTRIDELEASIRTATIRLDEIGFIIVSPQPPASIVAA
jgi:ATP-dependent helicase HepA